MNIDITIKQGDTFSLLLRWEEEPVVYKAISAISRTAPVQLTVTAHGLVDGWSGAVESVVGMKELNAKFSPPAGTEYHEVTVVDVDTIQFNDIDASLFSAYTSGGYVRYNTPVDLASFTARMNIVDSIGGAQLLRLTTENGRISIDNAAHTVALTIDAVDTAALVAGGGVYSLEMVSPTSVVTTIIEGAVAIVAEPTTS